MRLYYFDEGGSYYVYYGPTGTDYLSSRLFPSSDVVFFYEVSGDGEKLLYCIDVRESDSPYQYPCRLTLEDRGQQFETFVRDDETTGPFTFSDNYNGFSDMGMNYDGSIVVSGNSCCRAGFFGRVQAWKKQAGGEYRKVLSHVREDPDAGAYSEPEFGASIAVSDRFAATVTDPRYVDTVSSAQIYIYDLSGSLDAALTSQTETISLPAAYGGPGYAKDSLAFNRAGDHLSVALAVESESGPASSGSVAVFQNVGGVWSQKGQWIDGSTQLDEMGFYYEFGLMGLSQSGNSIAIVASIDCLDENDDFIDPCYAGLLTVWDYDEPSQLWAPRLGEGLPAKLPLSENPNGSIDRPVEVIFNEANQEVGVAVNGPTQDSLLRVSLEQPSNGLPIWLLYEASQ